MQEIDLTPEQLGAIKRSIALGRMLQQDLGEELKKFYVGGGSMSRAVKEFGNNRTEKALYDMIRYENRRKVK